jgi:hypothetical protein
VTGFIVVTSFIVVVVDNVDKFIVVDILPLFNMVDDSIKLTSFSFFAVTFVR